MTDYQLGAVESRFADIIWENEPIASAELCKLSESELGWKKSTTYTVLKRLCEKGLFGNEKGTVCSLVSREEFYSRRSERFVDEAFKGSLPAFLTAFTKSKSLSSDDISEIKRMLDEYAEENK